MRAALVLSAVTALLLAGCAQPAPQRMAPARPAPVPCLAQTDDGLFLTCLRTELDEAWRERFRTIGRDYPSPALTVGTPARPDSVPGTDRAPVATLDRAYFSPRSGIHFPIRYLDDVHAAHGSRAHIVLTFTIGHETGHHVQHLLHAGVEAPTVDVEAQADCYAGVWARQEADAGKIDTGEFRAAAEAELRRLSADPDEVRTHRSAEQRIATLDKGLQATDPAACDMGELTWPPANRPGERPG